MILVHKHGFVFLFESRFYLNPKFIDQRMKIFPVSYAFDNFDFREIFEIVITMFSNEFL